MRFEFTGKMTLYESEGGFASPDLCIDNKSISVAVWDALDGQQVELLNIDKLVASGKWSVVIERVE